MPYIAPNRREDLAQNPFGAETDGELNYIITTIAIDYLHKRIKRDGDRTKPNYSLLQEIHGVFGGAQAEWYRRLMAPYEDDKIRSNGDVYPASLIVKGNN